MNATIWALLGVVVGGLLSAGAAWLMQSRQFRHDERMHAINNQGKEAIKSILLEMLNHKSLHRQIIRRS